MPFAAGFRILSVDLLSLPKAKFEHNKLTIKIIFENFIYPPSITLSCACSEEQLTERPKPKPIREYIASRDNEPFEAPASLVDQCPRATLWTRPRAMPQFGLNAASAGWSFWNNK